MKLICLGTSSGTPTKTRNVSAYAILQESDKAWFLVDCGEGTQHRVMRAPGIPIEFEGDFNYPCAWRSLLWPSRFIGKR